MLDRSFIEIVKVIYASHPGDFRELKTALSHYLSSYPGKQLIEIGNYFIEEKNIFLARLSFELAVQKKEALAYYHLGKLHAWLGNYNDAANNFLVAYDRGIAEAEALLTKEIKHLKGEEIREIGLKLFEGEGVTINRLEAKKWFMAAVSRGAKEAYADLAHYAIEHCYNSRNLALAIFYFKQAMKTGLPFTVTRYEDFLENPPPSPTNKTELSLLMREKALYWQKKRKMQPASLLIKEEAFWQPKEKTPSDSFLSKYDKKQLIPTKTIRLKDCARLLLLGEKPLATTPEQQSRINHHKDLLELTLEQLRKPASTIIADRVFMVKGHLAEKDLEKMLNDLHAIPTIRPILELAKLAALGLHNLADRLCHKESYDSDYDDNSFFNPCEDTQKLTIYLNVETALSETSDSTTLGLFIHPHTCRIGAHNPTELRAALVHELTHFVATELFQNDSLPYRAMNEEHKTFFYENVLCLLDCVDDLDPVLRQVFSLYDLEKFPSEFIARIPEMIVLYQNSWGNGEARLEQQIPKLFNFYKNTFIPAVSKHTLFLQERALSFWPKELFDEKQKQMSLSS